MKFKIDEEPLATILDALVKDIPVPVEPTPYTATELMEKLQDAVRMLRKARDFCLSEVLYVSNRDGDVSVLLTSLNEEDVELLEELPLNESLAYELDLFIRGLK